MRKVWKIAKRVTIGVLLTLYVVVALLNYSVVQSYLGAAASRYLTKEWGGEVHIGALHAMPFDHLIMNNVRIVSPTNDTLLDVKRLRAGFRHFPFHDNGLWLERVSIRDGLMHLEIFPTETDGQVKTNLHYIIDHYTHGKPLEPPETPFPIDIKSILLNQVQFRLDLPDVQPWPYEQGVVITHMDWRNIRGRVTSLHVEGEDVLCHPRRLRAIERSGFTVDELNADIHICPTEIAVRDIEARTPGGRLVADVCLKYDGWENMEPYEHNVVHEIQLKEGTHLPVSDIAYWVPTLWDIDSEVEGEATMQGTLDNLHAEASLQWGLSSQLIATGRLRNLPGDSLNMSLDIDRLRCTAEDVVPFLDLIPEAKSRDKIAGMLEETGYVDLTARLQGGPHTTSTANIAISTGLGDLRADATLRPTEHGGLGFDLAAESDGIALNMLQNEWVSRTGFSVNTNGVWRNPKDLKTLYAELQGELINSVVRGQRLASVNLEGKIQRGIGELSVLSTDSLARLTLMSRFHAGDSIKQMHADLNVTHFDAAAFGLMPEKYGSISTCAAIRIEGTGIDEMEGEVHLDRTHIGDLSVERLRLTADAREGMKELHLKSDPVDITVMGRFQYTDIPLIMRQIRHEALPYDLAGEDTLSADELAQLSGSQLSLHLRWNDDGRFMQEVSDKMQIARGTRLDGSYSATELLKVVLRSDSVRMGSLLFDGIGMSGRPSDNGYIVALEAQEISAGALSLFERAEVTLNSNPQRILMDLAWGADGSSTDGDLRLRLREGNLSVLKGGFNIGDTPWELQSDSVRIDLTKGMKLASDRITLVSNNQSVTARLKMQQRKDDCIELNFDHFNIGPLVGFALRESPIDMAGSINGNFYLYGLNATPYFNANLRVDSCMLNQQQLGDIRLYSQWNAELNLLSLNLTGDQMDATGWIELGSKDPTLNFNVDFNDFDLQVVAPWLGEFADRFEGRLHGDFDITGTTTHPKVDGEAYVEDGVLGLIATGVTYYINDTLTFDNHRVNLNQFALRDPRGNIAILDGFINYRDLNNIKLDIHGSTDNLLILDLPQGDSFYGTMLASAEAYVKGPIDNLGVSVSARTNPGCRLTVPVDDQRQVQEQSYISFVSDQPQPLRQSATRTPSHINLTLDLAITPNMQLFLPMDFSEVTAKVSANGNGDMHLTLAGEEEPQILGSYEFTSGTMKLGLLSVIEKTFAIESGSSLGFQGSVPDTRFDLRAVYSQRVNLSTLTGTTSDLGGSQKYIQVEDVIAIAGTLQEPTLNFDIRLPNADASVSEEVFAYIDRNNERDMLNQTISLLVLGHFYNANTPSTNGNIATSGGIGALSNLLTDMVKVVDINVDYKAANEITKEQLDVNISKDWGRWYLESTLGYGGENRELQTGDAYGAVIDALVGYRLSPLVHLFAYNRTNTNDYTRMDLPYKQGVGLKLTKDFNRWSELFSKKKRK